MEDAALDARLRRAREVAEARTLLGVIPGLGGQVLGAAIGLRDALFKRGCRLEEHVGKLGPRHAGKQHRGGQDVQGKEDADPAAGGCAATGDDSTGSSPGPFPP